MPDPISAETVTKFILDLASHSRLAITMYMAFAGRGEATSPSPSWLPCFAAAFEGLIQNSSLWQGLVDCTTRLYGFAPYFPFALFIIVLDCVLYYRAWCIVRGRSFWQMVLSILMIVLHLGFFLDDVSFTLSSIRQVPGIGCYTDPGWPRTVSTLVNTVNDMVQATLYCIPLMRSMGDAKTLQIDSGAYRRLIFKTAMCLVFSSTSFIICSILVAKGDRFISFIFSEIALLFQILAACEMQFNSHRETDKASLGSIMALTPLHIKQKIFGARTSATSSRAAVTSHDVISQPASTESAMPNAVTQEQAITFGRKMAQHFRLALTAYMFIKGLRWGSRNNLSLILVVALFLASIEGILQSALTSQIVANCSTHMSVMYIAFVLATVMLDAVLYYRAWCLSHSKSVLQLVASILMVVAHFGLFMLDVVYSVGDLQDIPRVGCTSSPKWSRSVFSVFSTINDVAQIALFSLPLIFAANAMRSVPQDTAMYRRVVIKSIICLAISSVSNLLSSVLMISGQLWQAAIFSDIAVLFQTLSACEMQFNSLRETDKASLGAFIAMTPLDMRRRMTTGSLPSPDVRDFSQNSHSFGRM
ncbi:hypothetical protein HK105_205358 [Polyrhizophydium stewartii]|uniref:Uncharacterized protein n=1 Tax=Polyrhizophydium stewartii TaxID=2732419 RepID=A0ABR4N681_9FUNG